MDKYIDLTIPSLKQYYGKTAFKFFEYRNYEYQITDFAAFTGCHYESQFNINGVPYYGIIFIKNDAVKENVTFANLDGLSSPAQTSCKNAVIRPVFTSEKIYNDMKKYKLRIKNNVKTIKFGRYPQNAAEIDMQKKLNNGLIDKTLKETGKTFSYVLSDKVETLKEYTLDNRCFIRCKISFNNTLDVKILCNDNEYNDKYRQYFNNNYIWVEVLPVEWLVDDETKTFISKFGLISNVRFSYFANYDGNFSRTNIKMFMDEYMAKDLFALEKDFINSKIKNESLTQNAYDLDFENVTEEDIIKGTIESDVAVFLHGNSSEGKSARIKALDKDAVMIYLCNATPDSLNGKSVYNSITNEMIDIKPTWLIKLESICEKEPDKNHILFFDELTNALPSIQGIAFNIILDKEVNGKWKLPDNARVVAAGNEMEESISANKLSKPLFNRFAHVYIKTTTSSWIKWASENNIHPAIISYIAYTNGKALRSEYTGEKPNADPRKWEMASKMLYKTGKPEMIRALVGNEITKEFCHFCKIKTITLNDIVNGNITEEMLNMDIAEKYITVGSLTNIDIKYYEVVKCFIEKLGKEYLSLFNLLWSQNNEEKLEMVLEYEMEGKRKL